MAAKQYGKTMTPWRKREKSDEPGGEGRVQERRPGRSARGRNWTWEVLETVLKIWPLSLKKWKGVGKFSVGRIRLGGLGFAI